MAASLALDSVAPFEWGGELVLVSGGARGVDTAAESWALAYGHDTEVHHAEWDTHGKSAGYRRNAEMVDSGIDAAIVFWDGTSRGTRHTLSLVEHKGIPYVLVVRP